MRPVVSIILAGLFVAQGMAEDLPRVVGDLVGPFLAEKQHLGLVVGVVTPAGRSVFGYGTVPIGPAEIVPDGDTIFELGSITKAYTGVLLAVLERDGVVKLEDPANQHLPADLKLPRRGDRPITLLDLTTHHSGLPVQPPLFGLCSLVTGDSDNPYGTTTVQSWQRTSPTYGRTVIPARNMSTPIWAPASSAMRCLCGEGQIV